jgi:hypothetical protein
MVIAGYNLVADDLATRLQSALAAAGWTVRDLRRSDGDIGTVHFLAARGPRTVDVTINRAGGRANLVLGDQAVLRAPPAAATPAGGHVSDVPVPSGRVFRCEQPGHGSRREFFGSEATDHEASNRSSCEHVFASGPCPRAHAIGVCASTAGVEINEVFYEGDPMSPSDLRGQCEFGGRNAWHGAP